jgi:isovaleryl-CoA dehydrogenase
MHFEATEDQRAIASLYRAIALRYASLAPSAGSTFDWSTWRAIADAGIWRLPVPRERGGAGKSWQDFTIAFEAITSTKGSIGFAMAMANQATLIRALLKYATPLQCDRYLPGLLGGAIGATAISEKGTGTEIRALQTTLTMADSGFRLDGHKYNISHAPAAALILTAARCDSDGRSSTALVLLDPSLPGVARTPPQSTMGVRDLPIGDLEFDHVALDHHCLLGSPRDGLKHMMDIASMNRALFGLLCADAVQPSLAQALSYVRSRKTLEVALDSHQYVQKRLVDIRIGAERSRWMALAALDQLLAGHPEALANCSIAKLSAARDLSQSALDLLALYGSTGYRSGPLATFVADALGMISAGGTEEMHRRNIFAQMQRRDEGAAPVPLHKPAAEDVAA